MMVLISEFLKTVVFCILLPIAVGLDCLDMLQKIFPRMPVRLITVILAVRIFVSFTTIADSMIGVSLSLSLSLSSFLQALFASCSALPSLMISTHPIMNLHVPIHLGLLSSLVSVLLAGYSLAVALCAFLSAVFLILVRVVIAAPLIAVIYLIWKHNS